VPVKSLLLSLIKSVNMLDPAHELFYQSCDVKDILTFIINKRQQNANNRLIFFIDSIMVMI
jgi:hypothetical protein